MTIDVWGIPEHSPEKLPFVLCIKSGISGTPASTLGHAKSKIRMESGNTPVLGEDSDRFSPPESPVLDGRALKKLFSNSKDAIATDSSECCPGWHGRTVFSMAGASSPVLDFDVQTDGYYDISIGLIVEKPSTIEIAIDGTLIMPAKHLHHGGCPEMVTLSNQYLSSGTHEMSFRPDSAPGIYALKVAPRWRAIPSEKWWTIGPFPTAFEPQSPVCEVRKAMTTPFPPEKDEFDPGSVCRGVGEDEVCWSRSMLREGEHSDAGVDFPYRCRSMRSGVCYARTVITSLRERKAMILIGCDWWANAWVNGEAVTTIRPTASVAEDASHFNGWKPIPAEIQLKKGNNTLLVKCHRGRVANWFTCRINDMPDVKAEAERRPSNTNGRSVSL